MDRCRWTAIPDARASCHRGGASRDHALSGPHPCPASNHRPSGPPAVVHSRDGGTEATAISMFHVKHGPPTSRVSSAVRGPPATSDRSRSGCASRQGCAETRTDPRPSRGFAVRPDQAGRPHSVSDTLTSVGVGRIRCNSPRRSSRSTRRVSALGLRDTARARAAIRGERSEVSDRRRSASTSV